MTKMLPFSILAAAALASGGMAYAQSPAVKATNATHATVTKKTTTTTTAAAATKPAPTKSAAVTKKTSTRTAANTPSGRMVSTKTSTGKAITYNCSKAGNANKKACKG